MKKLKEEFAKNQSSIIIREEQYFEGMLLTDLRLQAEVEGGIWGTIKEVKENLWGKK